MSVACRIAPATPYNEVQVPLLHAWLGLLLLMSAHRGNSLAAGDPANATIFNETIVFINGLLEPDSTEDIIDFTKGQLAAGASPALGLTMVHIVMHELKGAIHMYM